MVGSSRIVAVLGPTNTGKTHYAIERMLSHRTGIIGLPLRLLAREVYDKIVALRGPSVVALVTGEERIVPPRSQYWVCTVEAMPQGMGTDFLAIDEIQLCADPERGHVFTDRLLRARGQLETLFLGASTMRGPIGALVAGVQFMRRDRMSQLTYSGSKKISRMPPRSAIVGFSVQNVYAIAELIRRQKGGAAVVMGALSPRTRNAQVAMYQNGEVDYLVATDAIGMGLNLDIDHVAFSSLSKFDGRRMRALAPNELAQIAGRAGRGMSDGTFGVTGEASPLDDGMAQAIMEHRFTPIKKLNWRSPDLNFASPEILIRSLQGASGALGNLDGQAGDEHLTKAREADDLGALISLSQVAEIQARASDVASVRLLWDVCRIPDFRAVSHAEHAVLLEAIFSYLHQSGVVPDDWLAAQIRRIDRTDGEIDALSKRLAYIRTWTYVAHRTGWVRDESYWRGETRAVEDRISDALHVALTQRFVDRRTSMLLRRLKQKEAILAEVNDNGDVSVEGEFVGRLSGFRFTPDKSAQGAEEKALKAAAGQALAPRFHLRADRFYNAPDTEIDFTEQGGLMWGEHSVGKLVAGAEALKPQIEVFVDDLAGAEVAQKVQRRLQHFIDRKIAALFEPLLDLQRDEDLTGLARGFAFRMVEGFGILTRAQVAQDVKELDQDARGALRKHGLRFGQFTIFMPLLLKPAPTRLRLVLWSLAQGLQEFPEAPPPGLVTVPAPKDAVPGYYAMCGYRAAGERAIRIDMLERLADMLRGENSRAGFEAKADMLSITGMTLEQFADLMTGLGYNATQGERVKVKAEPQPVAQKDAPAATEVSGDTDKSDAPASTESPPDTPEQDMPVAASTEAAPKSPEQDTPAVSTEAPPKSPEQDAPASTEATPAPVEQVTPESGDAPADAVTPELETFYTFTWAHRPVRGRDQARRDGPAQGQEAKSGGKRDARPGGKPRGKPGGKPSGRRAQNPGGKPQKGPQKGPQSGSKTFSARPPKREKPIDPDNPFAAALMGLRDDK